MREVRKCLRDGVLVFQRLVSVPSVIVELEDLALQERLQREEVLSTWSGQKADKLYRDILQRVPRIEAI